MDLHIITQPELARAPAPGASTVLLSGVWPHAVDRNIVQVDDVLDARYGWIDLEAERLAEVAGQSSVAWVNALALRYYLVKLLRVAVFFTQVQPILRGDRVWVTAGPDDRDVAALLKQLCLRVGATCHVQRTNAIQPTSARPRTEEPWRRRMRRWAERLQPSAHAQGSGPKVILCGNPRFLDAICGELHRRGCRQWWLYDQFAVKPFLRWAPRGVGQLTCQATALDESSEHPTPRLPSLLFEGIDLRPLVADWLTKRLASRADDQQRLTGQIAQHFDQFRPDLLVMDEDATPMKRIAVAMARRVGTKSFVVQHGAPVARFGFAPLAADGIFAWGQSSRDQFHRWGIPEDRIHITGSPSHDALQQSIRPHRRRPGRRLRILLLATVPPRDARPDVIEMNMTSRAYQEMIEAAFAGVASLPGATLVVKPHPRAKDDPIVAAAIARHPDLKVQQIQGGRLAGRLRNVDCVLSCLSSAGIEATLAAVPVIQLVPRGAGRILPHAEWGLFGSATDAAKVSELIRRAVSGEVASPGAPIGDVFASVSSWQNTHGKSQPAATRIADILIEQAVAGDRTNQPPRRTRSTSNGTGRPCMVGQ